MDELEELQELTKDEAVDHIINELIGTCNDLHPWEEAFEAIFNDSKYLTARLDQHIQRCEDCDWWSETHEIDEDGVCCDCR